jgi:hypothetical protein
LIQTTKERAVHQHERLQKKKKNGQRLFFNLSANAECPVFASFLGGAAGFGFRRGGLGSSTSSLPSDSSGAGFGTCKKENLI